MHRHSCLCRLLDNLVSFGFGRPPTRPRKTDDRERRSAAELFNTKTHGVSGLVELPAGRCRSAAHYTKYASAAPLCPLLPPSSSMYRSCRWPHLGATPEIVCALSAPPRNCAQSRPRWLASPGCRKNWGAARGTHFFGQVKSALYALMTCCVWRSLFMAPPPRSSCKRPHNCRRQSGAVHGCGLLNRCSAAQPATLWILRIGSSRGRVLRIARWRTLHSSAQYGAEQAARER